MKNKHHSNAVLTVVLSCLLLLQTMGSSRGVQAVTLDSTFKTTGYNNPIGLSGLTLKGLNPLTDQWEAVTTLTPTQTVRIEFTAEDFDGLDQVLIEVALVHDEDGLVASDGSDIVTTFENLANIDDSANEFDFYWNPSMVEGPQLALAEGFTTTSWALIGDNLSELQKGAQSFTFSFDFKVSKAAMADGNWMLNVLVMDDYSDVPSIPPTLAADRLENLTVQWYGEVTNPGSSTLDFGSLKAGMTYDDPSAKAQISLDFVANGAYEQRVKTDSFWKGTQISDTAVGVDLDTFKATLVQDTDQTDQSFAIRINAVDSPALGYTSGYIQLSHEASVLSKSITKTGESGFHQDLTMYLQLSDRFQNGSYNGTLYFGIENVLK